MNAEQFAKTATWLLAAHDIATGCPEVAKSFDLRSGYSQDKYNRVVSSPEPGVTLVEPLKVKPHAKPERLVYSEYNDKLGMYAATLSVQQRLTIEKMLRKVLSIDIAILNIRVLSSKKVVSVDFSLPTRLLGDNKIAPFAHPGLTVLLISESSINFSWDTDRSDHNWPLWLVAHN